MTGWFAGNRDYLFFATLCLLATGAVAWWLSRTCRLRHAPVLVWPGIAAVLFAGCLLVNHAGRATQTSIRQRIERLLPLYAQEMQNLGHARVATHADPNDPTYLQLIDAELRWQKWNPFVTDIYTFRLEADGRMIVVVDAETDYNHDGKFEGPREQRTRPGVLDIHPSPARHQAFAGATLLEDDVYTDSWGTWVSAYTPLRDEAGRIEAVLGVDLDSTLWLGEAMRARQLWIMVLAVLVAVILGSGTIVAVLRGELAQRRQAEQKLHEQAEVLRLAFEHAPEGMAMATIDGTYLVANPAYCRMLGYAHEELLRKKTSELSLPEDLPGERSAAAELIAGRTRLLSIQKRYRRKDGSVVNALLNTGLVRDKNGQPLYYVGHITDLTAVHEAERERQKFERKLLEAQKLESLGVLAGGVAHDFNNLLTAILGNATLIRLNLDAGSPALGYLARIEQASKTAAGLCQQLLAYSGRGALHPHPLDLGMLVRETADLLQVSVGKNTRLVLQAAAELPPILADPSQIRQVLLNLVLNAAESLGGGSGEIRLTTRCDPITREWLADARLGQELPAGDYVCLEVADRGQGMTEATLARIFDPFFTTKAAGRGLGLAAVLGIVRSHQGALKVCSAPGQGTTFTLLFRPHRVEAPAAQGSAPPAAPWRGSGHVLIVDDEAPVRETTAMMLAFFGFTTHPVASGEEALAHVNAGHPVDLVLLDLTMPGMDGFTAFARLRTLRPDLRIVIFSGYSEHDVHKKFAGAALNGFLQKPFAADALQRVVRTALSSG